MSSNLASEDVHGIISVFIRGAAFEYYWGRGLRPNSTERVFVKVELKMSLKRYMLHFTRIISMQLRIKHSSILYLGQ